MKNRWAGVSLGKWTGEMYQGLKQHNMSKNKTEADMLETPEEEMGAGAGEEGLSLLPSSS